MKDLSCLSKDLSRIVIVDNNPFSFLLQPVNGIPCIPFSAGQPRDDQVVELFSVLTLKHKFYIMMHHFAQYSSSASASGGPASTPEAPFYAERREARAL